jgi:LysM domain
MNATRAAALSIHRTENYARSRPRLHVVYRAEGSLATAPPAALPAALPAAAPPVDAPRKAPPPVAVPPAAPRPDAAPRPARHMPAAQSAASPLRLTRRGRVVVAGLAVLLVAVLSLLVAGAAQASSRAAPLGVAGHDLGQVVVRPGQSLWSVAESADPDADTRLVIQQILELNALHDDTVFAGQRLWVPRG